MSSVRVIGPLAFRSNTLSEGQIVEGHYHVYDHVTLCRKGSIRVEWMEKGALKSRILDSQHLEAWINIPKDVRHTLVGLEDGSIYDCIYPHRDEYGEIVTHYTGRDEAYASLSEKPTSG